MTFFFWHDFFFGTTLFFRTTPFFRHDFLLSALFFSARPGVGTSYIIIIIMYLNIPIISYHIILLYHNIPGSITIHPFILTSIHHHIPIHHHTSLYITIHPYTYPYTSIHHHSSLHIPIYPLYNTIYPYTSPYTPIHYHTPLYNTIHLYTRSSWKDKQIGFE